MRYGERTARGTVRGYEYWAVVLGERRRLRNSKRVMDIRDMMGDIVASSGVSARSVPDKNNKNNKRKERLVGR